MFDIWSDLTTAEREALGPVELAALQREAEAMRLDAVRSGGLVAECFGPEIPEAPARGPVRAVDFVGFFPKGDDDWEVKPAGFQGRRTMQRVDAFDLMEAMARRRLFTEGQKAMGRTYAATVERHDCAGMRCTSIETRTDRTGCGGGEFIDAVVQDGQMVQLWERRVGMGVALAVRRRSRRSEGGASRGLLLDIHLVRSVCIGGKTVSQVIEAAGWPKKGATVEAVRVALCAALDRMAGPVVRHGIKVMRTDGRGGW